jgi:hypothetical protein
MLPQTFEFPAAIVLVLGPGRVAGHRPFRVGRAIYGFSLGAMRAISVMGITNTSGMIVAGLVGGLVGALLFTFAYYVGIGILGASMAVFFVHVFFDYSKHADPPAVAVIVGSIAGAIVAMVLQRHVIIISTAFSGAWTTIVGAMAMAGNRVAERGGSQQRLDSLSLHARAGAAVGADRVVCAGSVRRGRAVGVTGRKKF